VVGDFHIDDGAGVETDAHLRKAQKEKAAT